MPRPDSRRPPLKRAPRLAFGAVGLIAAGVALQTMAAVPTHPLIQAKPAASLFALKAVALARTPAPTRVAATAIVPIQVRKGETLEAAVQRAGVGRDEAHRAVSALATAINTTHIKAGLAFVAAVARPGGPQGSARLLSLFMRTGPASAMTLSRGADGQLRSREIDEKILSDSKVAQGRMRGSLYESAERAGATPAITAQVIKLFSHKLDFNRDIQPGDPFRLVFERKVTASGRTIETGDLLYAEIAAKGRTTRFYRFNAPGSTEGQYFDDLGKTTKGFLLRTPVDGARVTSGFGMRMHPILGYTRMHQGIDFGVPVGTPVYAASDGMVEEAKWLGGYGRWLKLKHSGGWETAYGHLSGWAVKAGQRVHQGQVIAYSGSTGESTGPHLHYEVMQRGVKINPNGAKVPMGLALQGRSLAAFKAEKAHVDAVLARSTPDGRRLAQTSLRG